LTEAALYAAGIAHRDGGSNGEDDPLRAVERWVGLGNDDGTGRCCLTVEDCAPLSEEANDTIAALLIAVYTSPQVVVAAAEAPGEVTTSPPRTSTSHSSWHRTVCSIRSFTRTREKASGSFRATRWLCQLLYLGIDGEIDRSFAECLLAEQAEEEQQQQQQQGQGRSGSNNRSVRVIRALQQHVQDLPHLQSQKHKYSQSLKQNKQKSRQGKQQQQLSWKPQECSPPPSVFVFADLDRPCRPAAAVRGHAEGGVETHRRVRRARLEAATRRRGGVHDVVAVSAEALSQAHGRRSVAARAEPDVDGGELKAREHAGRRERPDATRSVSCPAGDEPCHRQLLFQHLIPLQKQNAMAL
jgi:hypothetical protein